MYLSADLDALTRRVGTGTFTVSQDPYSMNPDSKHSYRYVPICGSRCTDVMSRDYRIHCEFAQVLLKFPLFQAAEQKKSFGKKDNEI